MSIQLRVQCPVLSSWALNYVQGLVDGAGRAGLSEPVKDELRSRPESEWAALRTLHEDFDGPWGLNGELYDERSMRWAVWAKGRTGSRPGYDLGFSFASLVACLRQGRPAPEAEDDERWEAL